MSALLEHDIVEAIPMPQKKREYNFKPGISANPAGRPPVIKNVRDLARTHTEEMINLLLLCARDDTERWQVRQTAIQEVLNRGWGKVAQTVELNKNETTTVTLMSTEDIQRMLLANVEQTVIEGRSMDITEGVTSDAS